jgi:hypothetical protein
MGSPGISTFDVSPPYRAGSDDFNGNAKIDDAEAPPDAATMPSAAEYNTLTAQMCSVNKVIAVAKLSLGVLAGVYSMASFTAAGSAPTTPTFTITKNGTGDVSITWPANTFPPPVVAPESSLNHTAPGMITAYAITNGVRVVMLNSAGAAADMPFTVTVN